MSDGVDWLVIILGPRRTSDSENRSSAEIEISRGILLLNAREAQFVVTPHILQRGAVRAEHRQECLCHTHGFCAFISALTFSAASITRSVFSPRILRMSESE